MELVYRLAGLDCPHCAAEIEEAVSGMKHVTAAAVNLVKQTLTVESASSAETLLPEIEKNWPA